VCKNCDPVLNKGLCPFDVLQKSPGLPEDCDDKRRNVSALKVISLQQGVHLVVVKKKVTLTVCLFLLNNNSDYDNLPYYTEIY
jgi:hypothetical protein